MQLEQAISPTYSISSQLLKLNSTSLQASTPGHLGDMVSFEQFAQPSQPHPKPTKRLTIEIDEESTEQPKLPTQPPSPSLHENEQLKQMLKRKEQQLANAIQRNQELSLVVGQLEQERVTDRFYDQKLREKEKQYQQLSKVHEKVVLMNKALQRQLRQSQKKILQLQKQVQRNTYHATQEHIQKIKQHPTSKPRDPLKVSASLSNKQNLNGGNSRPRKATLSSMGLKKTTRGSSTNLTRKTTRG